MSASLALQTMIRTRLVADPAVTALVPPDHIADRPAQAPARFPAITLGAAREYPVGFLSRDASRVAVDLHVWTDTPGTAASKALADAVRRALRDAPWSADGQSVQQFRYSGAHFMADPADVDVTHGVISFEAHCVEREAL